MKFIIKRIKAFKFAFAGLISAIGTETAFIVHFLATLVVLILGAYYHVTKTEWCVLVICCGMVIAAELFNTAIERMCDRITKEKDSDIRFIKDVSAAGVLIVSLAAVVIGSIIFAGYLF